MFLTILWVGLYLSSALTEEELPKETDKEIFSWYKNKLDITKRSRGRVYRSLIMGLYLHKEG